MTADQIRAAFLSYFQEKGHLIVPSSSLVPVDDPTLLFTSAGMVPFKPYFMGEAPPPFDKAQGKPNRCLTSCQKCFRTTDIDSVGDASHLTFFEMLGNFSVGDYFKQGAIQFAWEFLTQRLGLPAERLWITIFQEDDEAFAIWRERGVPEERIVRCGEKDNFWGPAGEAPVVEWDEGLQANVVKEFVPFGPCGPCTEIHYDYGPKPGHENCDPSHGCDRFLEVWNLVFMAYFQQLDGSRTSLPTKNVDTGMGLERIAAVLQGKTNVYQTDGFAPLIAKAEALTGKRYGESAETDRALRVMAEHGRAATFLVADGVLPSNEGRGYVLRRVLRRAIRFARRLGREEPFDKLRTAPFLDQMAQEVIARMGHVYPELRERQEFVLRLLEQEETRFEQTLSVGLNVLEIEISNILEEFRHTQNAQDAIIRGGDAFRLYDTYGFPIEVTREIAAEHGLTVDEEGFQQEMERQRERARAAHRFYLGERGLAVYQELAKNPTTFLGYEITQAASSIIGLVVEGEGVDRIEGGQEAEVVLAETPFYAEAGGQVGDTGEIRGPSTGSGQGPNGRFIVEDTVRPLGDLIVHRGRVVEGSLSLDETVEAVVDTERRLDIARNHTGTHLLHAALRQVLGPQARQSGSLVAPDRLRFDFSHLSPLSAEELREIQRRVNAAIRQDLPVQASQTTFQEAVGWGAMALFDEKYGEQVRVVQVGPEESPFSLELCGGTHLRATGEIGSLLIVGESSIGAGLRRLEAVTGRGAEALVEERLDILEELAQTLGSPAGEVTAKTVVLMRDREEMQRRVALLERELGQREVDRKLAQPETLGSIKVVPCKVPVTSMETLRQVGDYARSKLLNMGDSGVVVLAADFDDRANFLAMVTPDLVPRGFHAGEIVDMVAKSTGGSGGGRPELGQAGSRDKTRIEEALRKTTQFIRFIQENRSA